MKNFFPHSLIVEVWLLSEEKFLQGYRKKGRATTSGPCLPFPILSMWILTGYIAYYFPVPSRSKEMIQILLV